MVYTKAKEIADLVTEHDDVHNAYDEAEDTGQINGHYKIVWYPDGEDYEVMDKTSKVITREFLLEALRKRGTELSDQIVKLDG